MSIRVSILEDDADIRELVRYALTGAGYSCGAYAQAGKLYAALQAGDVPDLLLLDIMLPDEDGLTVLSKLKQNARFSALPVILLTAKTAEYDRVKGLDLGADDYVPKPFGVMELLSRVRAVLRRVNPEAGKAMQREAAFLPDAALLVREDKREALVNGAPVTLTYKEFELLRTLMATPGVVMDRDTLLTRVWGADSLSEMHTVDAHIKTLRRKLGAAGGYIETVRGVGYRFAEGTAL